MGRKVYFMKKYLVIDERLDGTGDVFTEVFDTQDEADDSALGAWQHLTKKEQKERHIFVGEVSDDDLYEWAFDTDDDGKEMIDWSAYKQYDSVGFDSENL